MSLSDQGLSRQRIKRDETAMELLRYRKSQFDGDRDRAVE